MFEYNELAYTLAGMFWTKDSFLKIAIAAGYKPQFLKITDSGINNWIFFLFDAQTDGKIMDVIKAALLEKPENDYLKALLAGNMTFKSPYAGKKIIWKDKGDNKEKLTANESTLLPISFLELGLECARSVVRIRTGKALGSGFLIKNNFIMTNHHVIASVAEATCTEIQFNYQLDRDGALLEPVVFQLDPENGFATNGDSDWTVVKVKGNTENEYTPLTLGRKTIAKDDFVNIIQHPGGEHKQIALYHNEVTYSDEQIVQYLTDTLPGSSGCPVFNSQWEVVALHTSGGWMPDPESKTDVLRNQGTNMQLIKKEIAAVLPYLVL